MGKNMIKGKQRVVFSKNIVKSNEQLTLGTSDQ